MCVSVTSLSTSYLIHLQVQSKVPTAYTRRRDDILKIFNLWISLEKFCSKVMALFAYNDDPWHFL